MQNRKHVENIGEAVSVLIQVAQLAQKSGILSFDDAVVTKSAIDFLEELNKQNPEVQEPQSEQGPQ